MTQQGQNIPPPVTDITDIEREAALNRELSGMAPEEEQRLKDQQHAEQYHREKIMREHGLPSKTESTLPTCVDFALYPLGTTIPFHSYISEVEKVLKRCGLDYKVHEHGTTIKGDFMAIMYAIKCCHEATHIMGSPRVTTNIRVDTGMDKYKLASEPIRGVSE
ncbi:hypothetical protein BGX28_008421 [Mortierella sp. GBA30]|nr:hypothetical protein BGX28_008421 [Mortierella sp. GBA30]